MDIDYKKLYNETLQKLYEMVSKGIITEEVAKGICADFAVESEDEKIRQFFIHEVEGTSEEIMSYRGMNKESVLAWLKKQGEQKPAVIIPKFRIGDTIHKKGESTIYLMKIERITDGGSYVCNNERDFVNIKCQDDFELVEQKPADKVEPKFHQGEWITNGDYTWKIIEVKPLDYILQSQNGNIVDDTTSHVDEQFHSFTIEDAKAGDVLEFGDHGRLVIGIVSYVNKITGKVDVSCLLEGGLFKLGNFYNLDTINPHPVTKEQLNLLLQKIKEVGYEWDADKKELKKIEQKPAWSEEDESILQGIWDEILANKHNAKEYEWKTYDKFLDWLTSLKDRVQPKQEWSEEDEDILNTIINHFKIDIECTDEDDTVRWLKSAKDRILSQSKPKQSK